MINKVKLLIVLFLIILISFGSNVYAKDTQKVNFFNLKLDFNIDLQKYDLESNTKEEINKNHPITKDYVFEGMNEIFVFDSKEDSGFGTLSREGISLEESKKEYIQKHSKIIPKTYERYDKENYRIEKNIEFSYNDNPALFIKTIFSNGLVNYFILTTTDNHYGVYSTIITNKKIVPDIYENIEKCLKNDLKY